MLEPLPDKYPEQERDYEDDEHERDHRRYDAELQRGGRGVLAPAARDLREAIPLVSPAFLHAHGVPAPAAA